MDVSITKVSVFFDAETSKHRLDVEFTEAVSQALQETSDAQVSTDDLEEGIEGTSGDSSEDLRSDHEVGVEKKLWGSPINLAAYQEHSVTVVFKLLK